MKPFTTTKYIFSSSHHTYKTTTTKRFHHRPKKPTTDAQNAQATTRVLSMQVAHQASKDQKEETKTIEKQEKTQELTSCHPHSSLFQQKHETLIAYHHQKTPQKKTEQMKN